MRVESRRTARFILLLGQFLAQRFAFFQPFRVEGVEDLGQRAPANVFDQRRLVFLSSWTRFAFQCPERPNDFQVLLKLLFRSASAKPVSVSDPVAVEVPRRLVPRRAFVADGMVAVR